MSNYQKYVGAPHYVLIRLVIWYLGIVYMFTESHCKMLYH